MACRTAEPIVTFAEIRKINKILQGEIWIADLGERDGSIQCGKRPVIVLQNDVGNKYSPTTIVVPLTSQIVTINQSQLINKIGELNEDGYKAIKNAIVASFKGIL